MTGKSTWRIPVRRPVAVLAALLVGVWLATLAVAPALAHGDGDTDQASVLVLQAIGIITNKSTAMDDIMDKVDDALTAPNKEGVDLAKVQAAKEALDKEDMDQARDLLQQSLQSSTPVQGAKGEETGTTVVHPGLSMQGRPRGGDWVLLAVSILVLALGLWLAVRFRPAQSVRVLRRQLMTEPRGPTPNG